MPRGKKDKKTNPDWLGFVQCDLDTEKKRQFSAWLETETTVATLWERMVELCESGYKCSFTFNENTGAWTCSLSGTVSAPENSQGYALTARAGDVNRALGALIYKHDVVLGGDWSKGKPTAIQNRNDGDWVQ